MAYPRMSASKSQTTAVRNSRPLPLVKSVACAMRSAALSLFACRGIKRSTLSAGKAVVTSCNAVSTKVYQAVRPVPFTVGNKYLTMRLLSFLRFLATAFSAQVNDDSCLAAPYSLDCGKTRRTVLSSATGLAVTERVTA